MEYRTQFDPYELGLDVRGFSGEEAICICPFHADHNPSASMNLRTGLFFCFSCGQAATAHIIAAKLDGIVTSGVVNVQIQEENAEWRRLLNFPLARNNPYLQSRSVPVQDVEQFCIRETPSGVVFELKESPDFVSGILIRQYRAKPKYLIFGQRQLLWPMELLSTTAPGTRIYLTEGVFGALRARQAGLQGFACLGAMTNRRLGQILSSFRVYGLFDADFAGYVGAGRLLKSCPNAQIVIPGQEADELPVSVWKEIDDGILTTRSLKTLARLSKKPEKFYRMIG